MDDVQEPKIEVTPKEPDAVCVLLADGSIRVHSAEIKLLDLQRMLLMAAGSITERTLQRATIMEAVLVGIQARYGGFDAETEQAMRAALGRPSQQA